MDHNKVKNASQTEYLHELEERIIKKKILNNPIFS